MNKEVLFETSHVFPNPIMDVVNEGSSMYYYSLRELPEDLKAAGRACVKTFYTAARCFHMEFFRMLEDKEGLGKKGDIIGLEVNHRTPGGYTPDMMNYANDIDVYQIWANMVCYDKGYFDPEQRPYTCVYASRRKNGSYEYSHDEIFAKYGQNILMFEVMPEVLAGAMGDLAYMARFTTEEEALAYVEYVSKKKVG